jgi:hypothetical protein
MFNRKGGDDLFYKSKAAQKHNIVLCPCTEGIVCVHQFLQSDLQTAHRCHLFNTPFETGDTTRNVESSTQTPTLKYIYTFGNIHPNFHMPFAVCATREVLSKIQTIQTQPHCRNRSLNVLGSHSLVVVHRVCLGEVVGKVVARLPFHGEVARLDTVSEPVEAHVDGFGSALFHGPVGHTNSTSVVGYEWCGLLWIIKVTQGCTEPLCRLLVQKQRGVLSLKCR